MARIISVPATNTQTLAGSDLMHRINGHKLLNFLVFPPPAGSARDRKVVNDGRSAAVSSEQVSRQMFMDGRDNAAPPGLT